jgi:hypothetical protein
MVFSDSVKKKAFINSGGRCAICHNYPINQYHHITPKSESMDNRIENCCPLCSNCHSFIGRGGIQPEDQKIIRDVWNRQVSWMNLPNQEILLGTLYHDSFKLSNINKIVIDLEKKFKDYINTLRLSENRDELELKTSSLVMAIFATGSNVNESIDYPDRCKEK